ncbi:MAG TPA: DNA mismatch repair protein MutS, partial [Terriglobia bacterium]|nr:DNA mismatch repair protein MutS [Terriglobia bacterium]
MSGNDLTLTPMLRQYHAVKQEVPDALLLFRLGDFYELFFEDAVTASRELEITLTARNKDSDQPVPMCGVPYHAADGYIARLLKKGHKVAICDQMEPPQKGSKLVRREVTRIVTPGTVTDSNLLSPGENNYLLAVTESGDSLGCAFLDLSTGEFRASQFSGESRWSRLVLEVDHWSPREVIYPERIKGSLQQFDGITKTALDDWLFDLDYASRILRDQLKAATLEGFGLADKPLATGASGAIVHYVRQTQKTALEHVNTLSCQETASYLILDPSTIRNLELLESSAGESRDSLLGILNKTRTGMGARLLRGWMIRPSIDARDIEGRYDAVEELSRSTIVADEVSKSLDGIFDLERLLSRITIGTASPRELVALRSSVGKLPDVRGVLEKRKAPRFASLLSRLDLLEDLHALLSKAISDSPPPVVVDGGV